MEELGILPDYCPFVRGNNVTLKSNLELITLFNVINKIILEVMLRKLGRKRLFLYLAY